MTKIWHTKLLKYPMAGGAKKQLRGMHNHDNPGSGIEPDTVTLLTGDTLAYSPIFIKVEGWVRSRHLTSMRNIKRQCGMESKGGAFVADLPPTNVTRAQIPALKPYVG